MTEEGVDLQTLLNEASGATTPDTTADADNDTNDDTSTEPSSSAEPASPDTSSANATDLTDKTEAPVANKDASKAQAKSNPIKEIRDRLNETQKEKERITTVMQRYADGDYKFSIKEYKDDKGKIDYEALTNAMDEQDNKVKAESRGVTPEIQAEIDRIEKEKIELRKEQLKVSMDRAISNLQIDLNLNKADINKFFADALTVKKNPYQWLAQGGTLGDLYYLIYRDTLTKSAVDKAVAEAQAQWSKNNSAKAPTTNPASQASASSNSDGLSLEQLLNEASKR